MRLSRLIKTVIGKYYLPLKQWIYNLKEYEHLKALIKNVKKTDILSNKTIVINLVRILRNNIDVEGFIGLILALNGAKVKFLLDDGVLYHWDTISIDNWHTVPPKIKSIEKYSLNPFNYNHKNIYSLYRKTLERLILKKALKTYNVKNLEIIYYSKIIGNNNPRCENLEELKKHAISSTIRFFRNSDLDYNDKYVKYYYNLSLKNAILSRYVGEYILNKINPDYFIVPHGFYSSTGPSLDFLKKNGVKCYIWLGGNRRSRDQTRGILADENTKTLTRSIYWKKYKEIPVTEKMKQEVEKFFKYRYDEFSNDFEKPSLIKEKYLLKNQNSKFKYHIAMFPNIIWDSNIVETHNIFTGFIDWLISTIDYIKNRKDIKLYLRPHPLEVIKCKNTPRILDLLTKRINLENFENIVVIPPEAKINLYKFLKNKIDLAIVYDGFLGIELPYFKIPTIICVKDGFSSIEGGNLILNKREDYFNYLDNIGKVIEEFHQNFEKYYNNIVRYIYWYNNVISSIKTPMLKNYFKVGKKIRLMHLNTSDLTLYDNLLNFFNE